MREFNLEFKHFLNCPSCSRFLIQPSKPLEVTHNIKVAKNKFGNVKFHLEHCFGCGIEIGIRKENDQYLYIFQCPSCFCWSNDYTKLRKCFKCILSHHYWIEKVDDLIFTLTEANVKFSPTKELMINGLLKGLLNGVDALIC